MNNLGKDGEILSNKYSKYWDNEQEQIAALHQINHDLNEFINNMPGIAYRRKNDSNWSLEYISKVCFRITGYTRNEFIKGSVSLPHIMQPEDFRAIKAEIQKAIINKDQFTIEYRIIHKDGRMRVLEEKGQGIYDKNNKLLALEGFIQDITKEKETERLSFENEARNKALLEAMPDMIFIQDLDGVYLDCYTVNPKQFFIPPEKIIGKNMKEILPLNVFAVIKKAQERAIESGQLQVVEYATMAKDGEQFFEARIVHLNNHGILTIARNITEKRESERQILSNDARTRAMLRALPDLMIVYDKQGNHLEMHAPDNFQLAAPYSQHIGRNIDAILPKDVCDSIRKGFVNCHQTKKTQIVEYSLLIKNKLRHLESRVIETDEGNFLTIIRDITANKDVEKSIKENEQRLRLSLETGEFGSWDWNLLTDKIVRDDYQIRLLDLEDKKMHGTYHSFLEKVYSEDREQVEFEVKRAIKNETSYTLEFRILHSDKTIHWLHEKAKIFKNSKGESIRVIGITHDITEQKRAQEKLKVSDEKLRNYASELENRVEERTSELRNMVQKLTESNLSLEDQIQETNLAEEKALKRKFLIENISQNFPRGFVAVIDSDSCVEFLAGEELEDLGFKGLAKLRPKLDDFSMISEEVKTETLKYIHRTLKGEHCTFELEFLDRCFLVNTTPISNGDNKTEQVLLVYNNITLQKQSELKILNSLKRERELSELKSRFVSMASHEFRTPLSTILSSANLIERQNMVGKEEKRMGYVNRIKSSVKGLVVILNDFLSLSKLDEGQVIARPTVFDFVLFSKAIIDEFEGIKKQGQVIRFIKNETKIVVNLDPKLMRHIVYNLLSNAIKYSEENSIIDYKISTDNNLLFIEIIDDGIGIPVDEHTNLFQRFYRAKNSTNIEGTGLGLNIVKQYTELMGGVISFKSKIDEGSTFLVELPLNQNKNEKNSIN